MVSFIERQTQHKGDKISFLRMDAMMQKQELDNYFVTLNKKRNG